jgi:putative Mn2+ efflux pump MntP
MVFEGEKTRVFWWGLIFSAFSVCVLFTIFWYTLAISTGLDLVYLAPAIFGGIVFLLVGLYMMKSGTKKKEEGKTHLLNT